ncbi:glucose 1-dehydrogenase [Humisphaera borealis]|uniref:Glucose 1-dehydrogenase n=1 Tax=Humisphaera borealis TaxID=2807512 RepID=A0A7M2X3X2_9BACT|nr:glucose 1-dehydrogenase [Humisphaera borealis]
MRLEGKKVLVTGAGKGIGREICKLLSACGAEVFAVSRTAADLQSLAAEIPCKTIVADLAEAQQAVSAAEQALKLAGRIDCLVNNAGISIPQSFLDTTADAFDRTMAVNVRAVMLITQVIAKDWIARKSPGAVVNLSSQASMAALADHAAYCASKGGLDMLTKVMALELGPHQIRVNAVNPTVTLTPMGEMAWGDPKKSGPMLAKIPLGRFAKPIHVANAVAYLLSDAADMIHGVTLPVDGGFLAQ